ncbi:hypothetical protein [Mesorhizobium sp. WSM3860]|uniref:hypothetical protein n=1 Tax=Mesorhizobium sp. WSM3860 TaxID=2029403 RepID=UPI00159641D6|nr:hypothetical protein [Mesorhizobium sp. WSM3860]
MEDLPKLALSVRQPWAHCLMMGWKPVENRSWRAGNPGLKFRGDFVIHASTGMTRDEYEDCADLCRSLGFQCPPPAELARGGIVGVGTIVDIVTELDSPWFFGPKGLIIANARPVEFIPVAGQLGFFARAVREERQASRAGEMDAAAGAEGCYCEDRQGRLL